MLNLQPMQIHRHFDFRDQVFPIQHAASLPHVQDFNRKNVSGLPQFLVREKKRRGLFLLHAPPFHHPCQPAEFFHGQRTQNTNNVEVRVPLAKISARCRTKQNDALQVAGRKFF